MHSPIFARHPARANVVIALISVMGILAVSPGKLPGQTRRVYKASITPHWFECGDGFWFRNELPAGKSEFVIVDALQGARAKAFDHDRMALALTEVGQAVSPNSLPLRMLQFSQDRRELKFHCQGKAWSCNLENYALSELTAYEPVADDGFAIHPADVPRRSSQTGPETEIRFINRSKETVELLWLDAQGRGQSYGRLEPGKQRVQHTYQGHVWLVRSEQGNDLVAFQASSDSRDAAITGQPVRRRQRKLPSGGRPNASVSDRFIKSPDGRWMARVEGHNVFLDDLDSGVKTPLSNDGTDDASYGMLQWAPDSSTLIAFRITPGDEKQVYRIESSPASGGRAKLQTSAYALPGDRMTSYELNLFRVASQQQLKPDTDRIEYGGPRLRFRDDGDRFTYEHTDRGHQRFRLVEVNIQTGQVRHIIDEKTNTFIWNAHTQEFGIPKVRWLDNDSQIIYLSEQDGWRHIYLIDVKTGEQHQVTKGPWVVRGVDRIDEDSQQIWFRASGMNPDQDPYLIHFYRIRFDGSQLTALTAGNGNHRIDYSPDGRYIVDTFSRVDAAPQHQLRSAEDGHLICEIDRSDISELAASGWQAPKVFVAKGRDGQTDIWGIICLPRGYDMSKKYPVLEDIYAGPHDSHVPKSFSANDRYAALTKLGFAVVKIDGMGTANRSKAFHDVCWQNLGDAGFLDRIAWIKAAGREFPCLDVDRVGIFGTSAGGQNAAGAVLFHSEFYDAAYAACGCHDNRMDKASWNEQWMGYPVGPHYAASSNIENAHRLQGKLMLMVGELDTNVPPESTLRFADALIRANKDFELLFMPGVGHSDGGSYGRRRMREFFQRHLMPAP